MFRLRRAKSGGAIQVIIYFFIDSNSLPNDHIPHIWSFYNESRLNNPPLISRDLS